MILAVFAVNGTNYLLGVSTDRNFSTCFRERAHVAGHRLANGRNRLQVPGRLLANDRNKKLVLSWSQATSGPSVY